MKAVRCINQHWFDSDKYDVCPVCGEGVMTTPFAPPKETSKPKKQFSLFGGGKSRTKPEPEQQSKSREIQDTSSEELKKLKEEQEKSDERIRAEEDRARREEEEKKKQFEKSKGKTFDFWSSTSSAKFGETEEMPEETPVDEYEPTVDLSRSQRLVELAKREQKPSTPPVIPVSHDEIEEVQEVRETEPEPEPKETLQQVISSVSTNTEGRTTSYFNSMKKERMGGSGHKAEAAVEPSEPVVGWLICIEGVHFGASFEIYTGMNSVGRISTNRIVIPGDTGISREKHTLLTYEPKHRRFYIQPGDSSGLTYVNEEYITGSRQLQARDVIEIGNSRFMLIPLCGEDFSWEEFIK